MNLHDIIVGDDAIDYKAIEDAVFRDGADVDARDGHEMTPLMVSAMAGVDDLTAYLLRLRADPLAHDVMGNTAMHMAAMMGHAEVVETIFRNSGPRDGPRTLAMRDNRGKTPLHSAASAGHPSVVSKLLDLGADPAAVDDDGATPEADVAWEAGQGNAGQQAVLVLLRRPATPEQERMRKAMADAASAPPMAPPAWPGLERKAKKRKKIKEPREEL